MSAKSCIAMKKKDGIYKSIYCHNNGYLKHNGYLLYKHYSDPIEVEILLSLGDISKLEENIFPDITKEHNFDNCQDNVTVAYHRDRGEDLRFEVFSSKEKLLNYFSKSVLDYLYIYEDNKWYFVDKDNDLKVELLEESLLKAKLITRPKLSYNYDDKLALELMNYTKEFDPYEYNDIYDNDEVAFNDMKKNLSTISGIDTMIECLCNDMHYFASEKDLGSNDIFNLSKTAFNLLIKLNQYSKTLEKEDSKEIDI